MRRLVLRSFQSPGDVLMLTAALRDLHAACPGQFLTDVRTSAGAIWENNPHLTPLKENEPGVETLDMHYPLIHQSNQRPYHFIHGYTQYLEQQLDVRIPVTKFHGDVYLTAKEKETPGILEELGVPEGLPFWIIVAGGKYERKRGQNYFRQLNSSDPFSVQDGDKITVLTRGEADAFAVDKQLILFEHLRTGTPTIVANPADSTTANSFYGYLQQAVSMSTNRFAVAYIEPNLTTLETFDDTLVDPAAHDKLREGDITGAYQAFDQRRGSKGLKNSVFWAAYFSTAYEWAWNKDADANGIMGGEAGVLGETFGNLEEGTSIPGYEPYGMSIGFVEVIRDTWYNDDASRSRSADLNDLRSRVGVHEVAHQLLRLDMPDEAGHRNDTENIMHGQVDEVPPDKFYFSPHEIATLRKTSE